MIFYEAPHKLSATLKDMYKFWGDRKIALVKELTKMHEGVEITTLSSASEKYSDGGARGEYVIIVAPPEEEPEKGMSIGESVEFALRLMKEGKSVATAAKEAATVSGIRRGEIYKELIAAKNVDKE